MAWSVLSFVLWRKNKDRDLLWFAWTGALTFLAVVIDFLMRNVFNFPQPIPLISDVLAFVSASISIILLLWIVSKMLTRRWSGKNGRDS